jgi:hypothetical protein
MNLCTGLYTTLHFEVYEIVSHQAADGGADREVVVLDECLTPAEAMFSMRDLQAKDPSRKLKIDAVERTGWGRHTTYRRFK